MDKGETKDWGEFREMVEAQLTDIDSFRKATVARMDSMENTLGKNTEMTQQTLTAINEVRPLLQSLQDAVPLFNDMGGAARIFVRISKWLKPLIVVGAVTAAIWHFAKTGVWQWPTL